LSIIIISKNEIRYVTSANIKKQKILNLFIFFIQI